MRTLLKKLAKIKKDVIFEEFFYRSSYHHTSKMFNSTDFYALNEDHVEDISDDLIQMQTDKSAKDGKIEAFYRGQSIGLFDDLQEANEARYKIAEATFKETKKQK